MRQSLTSKMQKFGKYWKLGHKSDEINLDQHTRRRYNVKEARESRKKRKNGENYKKWQVRREKEGYPFGVGDF